MAPSDGSLTWIRIVPIWWRTLIHYQHQNHSGRAGFGDQLSPLTVKSRSKSCLYADNRAKLLFWQVRQGSQNCLHSKSIPEENITSSLHHLLKPSRRCFCHRRNFVSYYRLWNHSVTTTSNAPPHMVPLATAQLSLEESNALSRVVISCIQFNPTVSPLNKSDKCLILLESNLHLTKSEWIYLITLKNNMNSLFQAR